MMILSRFAQNANVNSPNVLFQKAAGLSSWAAAGQPAAIAASKSNRLSKLQLLRLLRNQNFWQMVICREQQKGTFGFLCRMFDNCRGNILRALIGPHGRKLVR